MKFPRLCDIYFKLFYSTYINIYVHRKNEEACKSNCVRLRLKRGEARVCHAPSVHTWDQLASERNLFHPKYKQYLIINKLRSRNWKYFRNLQTKSLYVDQKFLVINKHALIHPSVCSYSVVFSKFTLLSKVLHSRTIHFVGTDIDLICQERSSGYLSRSQPQKLETWNHQDDPILHFPSFVCNKARRNSYEFIRRRK